MATEYKDYYKTLGLEKGSDAKEIKKAYRKFARQYHPDVNPNDLTAADKFREISEAYEVLGDEEKRAIYDKYGEHYTDYETWKKAGGEATGISFDDYIRGPGAQARGYNPGAGAGGNYQYRTVNQEDMGDLFGEDSPYSDFFYSMFNGGGRPGGTSRNAGPVKGRDVEYGVQVALEEAFSGVKRVLEMAAEPGSAKATRRLEVSIPAGIQDGGRVRLAGLGSPGRNGGPNGDLYLIVEILPHVFFERKGNDLYAKINVPLTTMLLGGEAPMPTIKGGRLALKVPAGSANGSQIRLRGQGMPVQTGATERGDLYVELRVVLPTDLGNEEKTVLENFAQLVQKRQQEGQARGGVA